MKIFILKLMPSWLKAWLKELLATSELVLMSIFAWNGKMASLYYFLFSNQFNREHKAVLAGRISYQKSLREVGISSALLRRNTHRLEKGLIMKPRRAVFASAYIEETVVCFERCLKSGSINEQELHWAGDVLNSYFLAVTQDDSRVKRARIRYQRILDVHGSQVVGKGESVPYAQGSIKPSGVSFEQLNNLFIQRRSVRWFQQKEVDLALIQQAINAAALAPSACNRQPFKFYVVNDASKAPKIANLAMGTAGFSNNIPCLVAVVGDLGAYPSERDRHVIYIDGALAAMQLMLSFETLGLSSCPINWPDVESRERAMQAELGLKFHERTIMLIAVGYADPDGGIPFSQKKQHEQLMKEVN